MRWSSTMTSGSRSRTRRSASLPSDATPTVTRSSLVAIALRSPSRTIGLSSAMTRRICLVAGAALTRDRAVDIGAIREAQLDQDRADRHTVALTKTLLGERALELRRLDHTRVD